MITETMSNKKKELSNESFFRQKRIKRYCFSLLEFEWVTCLESEQLSSNQLNENLWFYYSSLNRVIWRENDWLLKTINECYSSNICPSISLCSFLIKNDKCLCSYAHFLTGLLSLRERIEICCCSRRTKKRHEHIDNDWWIQSIEYLNMRRTINWICGDWRELRAINRQISFEDRFTNLSPFHSKTWSPLWTYVLFIVEHFFFFILISTYQHVIVHRYLQDFLVLNE